MIKFNFSLEKNTRIYCMDIDSLVSSVIKDDFVKDLQTLNDLNDFNNLNKIMRILVIKAEKQKTKKKQKFLKFFGLIYLFV